MKFLIALFFILSIIPVQAQELDKVYYILGYEWDFSIPRHYESDLKSCKMTFAMRESRLGEIYRFSEVTGFKFKKQKPEEDCTNCHEFYEFVKIPSFYKFGNFFDFTYSRVKENYYGFGEIEVEKQHGVYKPSVLENVTQLQMKSFLAGVYLDGGSIKGDTIILKFHQVQNQKLIVVQNFINKIEKPRFLSIKHRKEEGQEEGLMYGPTLFLLPNNELRDLFANEEERKNALMASYTILKK